MFRLITSIPGWNAGILNATVSLQDTDHISSSTQDGGFTLDQIPDGTYMLTVTATNFRDHTEEVTVSGSNVDIGSVELDIEIYTEDRMIQEIAGILAWGDLDGDGKIGLEEAIRALRIASGVE